MPKAIDHPAVREQVRLAYIANGGNLSEAARACGVPIDRAEKWKERGKWTLKGSVSEAVGRVVDNAARTLSERRTKSALHLAKYAEDAGERLSRSRGSLKHARTFQQIAAGRANVFPEQAPSTAIQVNVLSFEAIRDDKPAVEQ